MAVAATDSSPTEGRDYSQVAREFAKQAERLGQEDPAVSKDNEVSSEAIEARFITAQDAVIQTADGGRLPAVPVHEAVKLNDLKHELQGEPLLSQPPTQGTLRQGKDGTVHGIPPEPQSSSEDSETADRDLGNTEPQYSTSPLFPPVPMYGPPSLMLKLQCYTFRTSSWFLSLAFLGVILLGALFSTIPIPLARVWSRLKGQNPYAKRPFYEEEKRRQVERREAEENWTRNNKRKHGRDSGAAEEEAYGAEAFAPLEGGPDPLICDASYYARRVGLNIEEFKVQTEDGFIICLWHVYNPQDYRPAHPEHRRHKSAEVFRDGFVPQGNERGAFAKTYSDGNKKYPVLLMHGLLQSGGAYCCNDDDSLAFFLAKSGYDVWIGNNRCGFQPEHTRLTNPDPRMWAWNIRQMGVMDLPALISRVLEETGFEKLGLVCHSQGTAQTFVALAKEQRPDIGDKISVFCALAPAAYAGPLIKKMYFKFMRIISPGLFRIFFGIHSFIPFMNQMHAILPGGFYGTMGYMVFSFLFSWSDERWDRGLRDRAFQFSPTYVSAESMRWWLGRECFATQRCILSTKTEGKIEDEEDWEEDNFGKPTMDQNTGSINLACHATNHDHKNRGKYSWYDERAPPMAFWVAGGDLLVDGRRLLRRFDRGREPYVKVVHRKIIEGYEHLDLLWAIDSIEQVGKEVREVIWRSAAQSARDVCRIPVGCENVGGFADKSKETFVDSSTGGLVDANDISKES